jgi:uncharacterized protein
VTTRAVLDTNVLVSGLGWSGPPAAILDAVSDGRMVLITSAPLLDELRRVLAYRSSPRSSATLPASPTSSRRAALSWSPIACSPSSMTRATTACWRPPRAAADYIVSGDKDLLDLGSFEGIPIVTAAQFVPAVLGRGPDEL